MNDNGGGIDARLAAIGRALSCDVRLAVLRILAGGDASVSELTDRTGVTQPNMSNHLAVLRTAGLVTGLREGRVIRYRLASREAADLVRSLLVVAEANPS
ncbi:ArsR/SmtB family transcription factor [Nocardia blacklockiae]|uniref:ArsR/SmtB family transcription factor n=1 Tax=Nocardia blacklockiae TaxID=480036 RepID=UPI001895B20B|nr:metalloregulator ArsR/SmtB family transcription factor [Nocardia blacklockiae]MBF6176477.1 helix-turn-helix transcriptional regulator [Nocardia blacklockiae]